MHVIPDDIAESWNLPSGSRQPLIVKETLRRYLDACGLGSGDLVVERLGDGHSNVNYRLRRGDADLVLRRPPRPPYPPSTHDVLREARVLDALASTTVRSPRVRATCADDSLIGAPFYITDFVAGTVFTLETPPMLDTPSERRRIGEEILDALVEIHAVDWQDGLEGIGRPVGYLDRQLRRFTGLWVSYKTRELPAMDRLTRWLCSNRPMSETTTLVHGDYRLGNVMYAARAPATLVAVLDWEMATIGDPLADLGYLAATWAEPGDPEGLLKLSAATAAGYPPRAALTEGYAERTGRSVATVNWYIALALWKVCILMEGNYVRTRSGASNDDFAAEFWSEIPEIADHGVRLAEM